MSICTWPLKDGNTLNFTVYDPKSITWSNAAGLYIFAYYDGIYWRALYVGQTNNFSSRIPSHERIAEAFRRGATHVHALVVPLAANRDRLERLLIEQLQPPMNEQLRNLSRLAV